MKYLKYVFIILFIITTNIFSQHLPLSIGNEWHYNHGLGPEPVHIARAVDTIQINNKVFFKIENYYLNPIFQTSIQYDRIEGDSLYYRLRIDGETLLFNFNWQDNQVIVTPLDNDSTCFSIQVMDRDTCTIWGLHTEYYSPNTGILCPAISPDTSWVLSSFSYLKNFGCLDADDGLLIGAKINGIPYGNLHPIPVELFSFSKQIISNSVELKWSTATETNNFGFEILRSIFPDSNSTLTIDFIKGNGTTSEKNDYKFLDKNLRQGDYKYQLIQIDYDGTRNQIAETEASITNPNSYTLDQNYPNPFNPITNINFSIPQRSKVELIIYNTLGQRIATVVNEQKEAGYYTVAFNGINLPSGVYFYRISAGEFSQTKKLILLK